MLPAIFRTIGGCACAARAVWGKRNEGRGEATHSAPAWHLRGASARGAGRVGARFRGMRVFWERALIEVASGWGKILVV